MAQRTFKLVCSQCRAHASPSAHVQRQIVYEFLNTYILAWQQEQNHVLKQAASCLDRRTVEYVAVGPILFLTPGEPARTAGEPVSCCLRMEGSAAQHTLLWCRWGDTDA